MNTAHIENEDADGVSDMKMHEEYYKLQVTHDGGKTHWSQASEDVTRKWGKARLVMGYE